MPPGWREKRERKIRGNNVRGTVRLYVIDLGDQKDKSIVMGKACYLGFLGCMDAEYEPPVTSMKSQEHREEHPPGHYDS